METRSAGKRSIELNLSQYHTYSRMIADYTTRQNRRCDVSDVAEVKEEVPDMRFDAIFPCVFDF